MRSGGKSLRPEIRLAVALFLAIALVGAGIGVAATHQGPAPHGSSTLAAASTGQASTADIGPIQLGGLPPISIPVPDLSGLASGLLGGLNPSPAPPAPVVGTPAAAPAAPATVPGIPATSLVADAAVNSVPIFGSAGGSSNMSVSGYNVEGQREAFLVLSSQPGWYQVEVPVRPNGTTGWIRASDVTTRSDPWYITVSQSQFKLNLYENGQLQNSFTVAVGVPATPTPNGSFFVWATQHWNQYPYAVGIFALSAFSPVLVNWPGGGRTGIHGWTDASVMGKRASNGCVRMTGNDFSVLMNNVPLGTPVVISD
ncbi:MAG TPA: L,D-transpeptidase [Actinomycetota bacterium]|nr:L,D-transpeptidase [Actinomycetota bacterium]